MKRYRYFLDSTELADDPIGWDKFKQKIHLVPELNARLLRIDVDLVFHGDGFAYLLTQKNTLGHCGLVTIEIQELNNDLQTYRVVHNGYIFISDMSIDRKEMLVKTSIEDNSFYARINNNKSIDTFPWATLSKNQVTITKAPFNYVHYVNPADCSVFPVLLIHQDADGIYYDNAHYRVYDLFRYLVDFVGDGLIDFESTLFDTGGDYAGLMWTVGEVLRLNSTGTTEDAFKANFPKLSFLKLFTEINKKVHLGMRIEITAGRPVLRIERDSYFRQSNTIHTCDNIDKVTESTAKQKLYSKIKLGSTITDDAASLSFPEGITFLGFKEEDFIILGECNLDRELNLVSEVIISSNIIEDMVVNGAVSYKSTPVLVMTEPYYGDWIAKTGNVFGDPTPCQYNLDLTNVAVTQNWIDGIPNSMAQYLASPVDLFKAQNTAVHNLLLNTQSSITYVPVAYNDDTSAGFFDVNGQYDAVTDFDFTSAADGSYSFRIYTKTVSYSPNPLFADSKDIQVDVKVRVYDAGGLAGGNLISETTSTENFSFTSYSNNNFNWYTPAIYMQNTYRAVIAITVTNNSWIPTDPSTHAFVLLETGSYWQCIGSQQGGIVQGIDPADYPINLHEFVQELTPDKFDAINADSRGLIDCTTHNNYAFSGWIEELEFDRAKGMAKFKLYSTQNING